MPGLYIHIPFCKKKCPYCDFISYDNKSDLIDEYLNAINKEIIFYKNKIDFNFDTVYIGGGTPSILSEKQIEKLFKNLFLVIDKNKIKEITIEINPGTINKYKTEIIIENANRVSIGAQSFNDKILEFLERIHKSREIFITYDILKKGGIKKINIDLMYGICGQKIKDVIFDISEAIKLSPEHISFYMFTINNKKFKGKDMPDDVTIEKMYFEGIEKLKQSNFIHYEISNLSKKNCFCLHNLNYWNYGEYLGIGVGAFSYIKNIRFKNIENINEYIKKIKKQNNAIAYREKITDKIRLNEYIMLKFRTKDGIDTEEFFNNFKFDFYLKYSNIIDKYIRKKCIKKEKKKIYLTEKGFLLSNEIIKDFF